MDEYIYYCQGLIIDELNQFVTVAIDVSRLKGV